MDRRSFLGAAGLAAAVGPRAGAGRASPPAPTMIVNGSDASKPSAAFFELNRKGGVGCVMSNGWDEPDLAAVRGDPAVRVVFTWADIEAAQREGKLAVILGDQDADAFSEAAGNDWGYLSDKPRIKLRERYDAGLRVLNFCYNLANQFGGGCLDPEVPLTRSGRWLQDALEEIGVLVDTGGHTGRRTALDVARRAKKPVICSHANIKALNDNVRNLSDDVIRAIADTGGVVGLTASEDLMERNGSNAGRDLPRCPLARYAQDIEYVRALVGVDHVGLGPDFVHGKHMPYGLGRSMIFPPEMVEPQEPLRFTVGFEDPSQFPNVAAELRRRGWSQGDVAKVMGGNWLRVYRAVWS